MRKKHVFPSWAGTWLLNPLRKARLNPEKILGPHVEAGMTILDAGCGTGFFSIPLARMTGSTGTVYCADPQQSMLEVLSKRARKRGLSDIVKIRPCGYSSLRVDDLRERVDVALAFGVLHEVENKDAFLRQIESTLKPEGILCFGEPHVVSSKEFDREVAAIEEKGFERFGTWRQAQNKIVFMRKRCGAPRSGPMGETPDRPPGGTTFT